MHWRIRKGLRHLPPVAAAPDSPRRLPGSRQRSTARRPPGRRASERSRAASFGAPRELAQVARRLVEGAAPARRWSRPRRRPRSRRPTSKCASPAPSRAARSSRRRSCDRQRATRTASRSAGGGCVREMPSRTAPHQVVRLRTTTIRSLLVEEGRKRYNAPSAPRRPKVINQHQNLLRSAARRVSWRPGRPTNAPINRLAKEVRRTRRRTSVRLPRVLPRIS